MILRAITSNLDKPGSDVLWAAPKGVKLKSLFMNPEMAGKLFLPLEKVGQAVDSIHANQLPRGYDGWCLRAWIS